MKNLLILFCLLSSSQILVAQSWQKKFQISAIPKQILETSNGNLNVHCFDPTDSTWFKLIVNEFGDSLGGEYFTPIKRNYNTIEVQGNQQYLTYWDTLDNIVLEIPVTIPFYPIPSSTTITTSYSGLVFINFFHQIGVIDREGTIWIYDQNGNLIFNELIDSPFNISHWTVAHKLDGTTLLTSGSSTGWLPQGAKRTVYHYYLFDSIGNVVCEDLGYDSNYNDTRLLDDLAINLLGNCDAIGDQVDGISDSGGLIDIDVTGQFTPCTDFIIPPELEFLSNVQLIGLSTDAYAAIGYDLQELTLTRIDCSNPIHQELCLYSNPVNNLTQLVCFGEEYIFGEDTITTSGYYSNTFMDINGCDSLVNIQIIVIPSDPMVNPEFEAGNGTGFINLNTNCSNCTYLWSNGLDTENLSNLNYGTYSVTITTLNNCKYIYEFDLDLNTSINSFSDPKAFNLYPSICGKGESMTLEGTCNEDISIRIFDANGTLVKKNNHFNTNKTSFEAPDVPGLYIVQVLNRNQLIKAQKIIIN